MTFNSCEDVNCEGVSGHNGGPGSFQRGSLMHLFLYSINILLLVVCHVYQGSVISFLVCVFCVVLFSMLRASVVLLYNPAAI